MKSDDNFFEGIESLIDQLREFSERVQYNVLRTSIFRGAQMVRDLAKQKLQSNGSVKTGRLLRDIKASRARSSLKTEVVAKVEGGTRRGKRAAWYGFLVEKGHLVKRGKGGKGKNKKTIGQVPARPFLVPALEENKEKIKQEILEGLKKELQKAISGIKK